MSIGVTGSAALVGVVGGRDSTESMPELNLDALAQGSIRDFETARGTLQMAP